jgi:hypothetical protein
MVERADIASKLSDPERSCGVRPIGSPFAAPILSQRQEVLDHRRDFYQQSIRGQMEALLTELGKDFESRTEMFRQSRDIRFLA